MLSASVQTVQAEKIRIRTSKRDSAFVYAVLEAQEGVTAYSTLPNQVGDPHRDLELCFTPEFRKEVLRILAELGSMVTVFYS